MKVKIFLAFIIFALQAAFASAPRDLQVSFVNFYPGADIYELEGHSALRVKYGNADLAISYGTFDFNAPNFVYRYVKGETDYWVIAADWEAFVKQYELAGRKIVEHRIDMDSVQRDRFMQLLAENLKPENATYRYNYVKDNCSLRPMRLLQAALGDSIILSQPKCEAAADGTYRQVMRRYHKNYPWYQFGIDLALGSGIDKPITAWDKAFAPVVLDAQLADATVGGRKLVAESRVLYEGKDATLGPTPWLLTPLAVCWLLFIAIAVVATLDIRRLRISRWAYAALFGVYGLAGCLLAFLVFVSTHEATSPNWLLLWLNPICLTVPIFIWLKKCKKVVMSYLFLNFALILAMVIALPIARQSINSAFWPLILCDVLLSFTYIYVRIRTDKKHNTLR